MYVYVYRVLSFTDTRVVRNTSIILGRCLFALLGLFFLHPVAEAEAEAAAAARKFGQCFSFFPYPLLKVLYIKRINWSLETVAFLDWNE